MGAWKNSARVVTTVSVSLRAVWVGALVFAVGWVPRATALGAPPPGSPGYWVRTVSISEIQHLGSPGRQVAPGPPGVLQAYSQGGPGEVFWSRAITGTVSAITLDNGHVLDALSMTGITGIGCGIAGCCLGGGFCSSPNLRTLATGRAVAAHDNAHTLLPDEIAASSDAIAGGGFFSPVFAPQPAGDPTNVGFVKLAVDVVGADTVIHLVATERDLPIETPDVLDVYYWRGILGIGGPQEITWSPAVLIDSVTTLAAIVEASPVSDDVAIVYSRHRTPGTQTDNDVVLRRSSDGGLTWQAPQNITQYADADADRAYQDVTAVYDDDNTLHVVYNTLHVETDGQIRFIPCDLWHWNDDRNTGRVITSATWTNDCSLTSPDRGGQFKLQLAKPNLAVKPAGAGPGAGIAEEQLYVVWVQFGPTDSDCATQDSVGTPGGYVNGEIFRSVSADDGNTWDRPENITGTQTPDCLPEDCSSEDWVSAAERADSGLYLSYVEDAHAGSYAFASQGTNHLHHLDEGELTYNSRFMLYAPATRLPVQSPAIVVTPTATPEAIISNAGLIDTVEVSVFNFGNQQLNFLVEVTDDDGGQSHVTVNGGLSYTGSIPPGGFSELLIVELHGTGMPDATAVTWRLEITSDDAINDPGQGGVPIDVEINALVREPGGWVSGLVWYDWGLDCSVNPNLGALGFVVDASPGGYGTTSDDNGTYEIWVPAGSYVVALFPPAPWDVTCPPDFGLYPVDVQDGDSLIDLDFGVFQGGCIIVVPGDVNLSGHISSADIIYMVSYVFKSDIAPLPCEANGDVDCTGAVNSADIIYLVNYVFKGGPWPCDICNDSPLGAGCF